MNDEQRRADELQDRLIDFAVRIIGLSSKLPKQPAGRHIAGQILRSATSPPPADLLSDIVDENQQLCRIFTASIKTARFCR